MRFLSKLMRRCRRGTEPPRPKPKPAPMNGRLLGAMIAEALGIPTDNVTRIVLVADAREPARIEITRYIEEDCIIGCVTEMKGLMLIDEPGGATNENAKPIPPTSNKGRCDSEDPRRIDLLGD